MFAKYLGYGYIIDGHKKSPSTPEKVLGFSCFTKESFMMKQ
jgi:hypothetical protein